MRRPTTVTVFAVLDLVFGFLGLCGAGFGVMALAFMAGTGDTFSSGPMKIENPLTSDNVYLRGWTYFSMVSNVVTAILLIASGFGLLQMRNWARLVTLGYAVYALFALVIGTVIAYYTQWLPLLEQVKDDPAAQAGAMGGMVGGVFGICFGIAYPVAILYFLTRPYVVDAFYRTGEAEEAIDVEQLVQRFESSPAAAGGANPYASPMTAGSAPLPAAGAAVADPISTLVPTGNPAALWSYYLGLFSLFPLCGSPMGIVALVMGIKGLRAANRKPEIRGKAHAWVGIICGSLFGLFNTLLLVGVIVGLVTAAMKP